MKVINLSDKNPVPSKVYTCNVYLVLGASNAIEDVNTLVDVGMNPAVLDSIDASATGVGKKRVEQVVLTHSHFDHAGLLPEVRQRFGPKVFAFSPMKGVDETLHHRQRLRMGDRDFEVLHTPGHSHDSVCLFCAEEGVLFAGDTPLLIRSDGGSYEEEYVLALQHLATLPIDTVYFGHGPPLTTDASERIQETLANVRDARKRAPSPCGTTDQ